MRIILLISFLAAWQTVFGQTSVPVFASRADSTAYAQLQEEITRWFRSQDPHRLAKIDSLFRLQADYRSKIIGYRILYLPKPDFTTLEALEQGKIQPKEVTRLSINQHTSLPRQLYECINLQELEIMNSGIRVLPRRLRQLTSLRHIGVYNHRTALKIRRNPVVHSLEIQGTEQKFLPASYRKLPNLDSLNLSQNIGMNRFPKIFKNQRLVRVTLNNNLLTLADLPKGKEMPTVKELHLQRNRISEVPQGIETFSGLQKLTFNYNDISRVAGGLGQLTQLQDLSFYNNKLTEIPQAVLRLTNLQVIDLYYNRINQVDNGITQLNKLEVLYLSNNQISALPDGIGQMQQLRELYIHNNKFSYLPESLGNLHQLRVLRMNDNQFTSFPDPVLKLTGLQNLDISHNNLRQLPEELTHFRQLSIFALGDNPWDNTDALQEICKQLEETGAVIHR